MEGGMFGDKPNDRNIARTRKEKNDRKRLKETRWKERERCPSRRKEG
jgi:hypothetical protein